MKMKLVIMMMLLWTTGAFAETPKFKAMTEERIDGKLLVTDPQFRWKGKNFRIETTDDSPVGVCALLGRQGHFKLVDTWSSPEPWVEIDRTGKIIDTGTNRTSIIHVMVCD